MSIPGVPPELQSSMNFEELVLVMLAMITEKLQIPPHELVLAMSEYISMRAAKHDDPA